MCSKGSRQREFLKVKTQVYINYFERIESVDKNNIGLFRIGHLINHETGVHQNKPHSESCNRM